MSESIDNQTIAIFESALNRKRIEQLRRNGAVPVLFPTVETIPNDELRLDLSTLTADFDWLVFTDVYTVDYFLERLRAIDFDFYELDRLRVVAYGETVADYLRYAQLHADVVPSNLKIETVVGDLKNYLFDEAEFQRLRFLVVGEQTAAPEIVSELEALGGSVVFCPVYQIIASETPDLTKAKTLLRGGAIDEFIFSTPHDVINLAYFFQRENLNDVLEETKISFSDQATKQSLEEFRLL